MKFTPEDFNILHEGHQPLTLWFRKQVADQANAKLEEWLKEAIVVQGNSGQYPDGDIYFDIPIGGPPYTHKAKLIQIEELK